MAFASLPSARVDAVTAPVGIDARPSSTPLRYATKPSSNIASPRIDATAAGSASEKYVTK